MDNSKLVASIPEQYLERMRQDAAQLTRTWFKRIYPASKIGINRTISPEAVTVEALIYLDAQSAPLASASVQRVRGSGMGDNYIRNAERDAIIKAIGKITFTIKVDAPVQAEAEQPVPVQAEVEQPTPIQTEAEQPVPVQAEAEQPVPVQAEVEQPAPVQAEAEQPVPVQAEAEQPVPIQAKAEQPVPVQAEVEQPTPIQTEAEQPIPIQAKVEQPTPIQTVAEQPAPPELTLLPGGTQGATRWMPSMAAEEIMRFMTVEEAQGYPISSGICAGMRVGDIAQGKMGTLSWYAHSYSGEDHALTAAAHILLSKARENAG